MRDTFRQHQMLAYRRHLGTFGSVITSDPIPDCGMLGIQSVSRGAGLIVLEVGGRVFSALLRENQS